MDNKLNKILKSNRYYNFYIIISKLNNISLKKFFNNIFLKYL